MVRFMIYLLETGICLSLLYLAYWLFLGRRPILISTACSWWEALHWPCCSPASPELLYSPGESAGKSGQGGIEKVPDCL
jgi:hypothetical protein